MTFSIVARSADGESWGVAVASKFLAVGSAVPAAVAGVGAIATQADANVAYKGMALSHLDEGATAEVALRRLLEEDEGATTARSASSTSTAARRPTPGSDCLDWAGGVTGDGVAIQGNILAGPEVVEAMKAAWDADGRPAARPTAARRAERPATTRAVTGADGSRRRCSSYATRPATAASTTSRSTCGSTTTPARSPSWPGCSTSTTSTSPPRPRRSKVPVTDGAGGRARPARPRPGPRRLPRLGRQRELRDARRRGRGTGLGRQGRARDHQGRAMTILAIDAGTTGVTALVVTGDGRIAAKGYQEFPQHFPRPGWVEHAPEEIWQATLEATRAVLVAWDGDAADLRGIGITNQRETVLLWDRETLGAPRRAIVWQDRRTAAICSRLRDEGHEERVTELTGLRLDPYFSGTKLIWLAENEPHTWALVESGRVRGRHRRLLPDRPDDPRHLARHRRLQRLPHAAVRPRRRRLVRRAVRPVRRPARRAARAGPELGRARDHRPDGVPRPRAADRRDRRRPAVRAVRADLLRRGRLEVHLRHRARSSSPTPAGSIVRSDAGLLSTAAWRTPDGELDLRRSRARSS